MLISNVIVYLRNKTPDILLGRLSGPQAAGIFSMGYEVANLATTDLVAPINRAVLPGYVILGKDAHALREGYAQVLGFIALLGVPAAIGVAALSKQVVGIVLGDKWSATADLIGILALASGMHVMLTNSAPVYLAVGKPRLIALLSMIHIVTLLPLLVGGILKFGATGAAWAYLAHTAVVALPSTFYLLIRNSAITVRDIGGSVWRPVLSAAIMYFLVRRIADALGGGTAGNQLLTLVVAVLAGAALYGALIVLLWRISGAPSGPERTLLNTARTAIRRRVQPVV
jgi:O-antigen/teichoic acid export membrane protein